MAAFPTYLAELAVRLEESELRRAVLANMADEKGVADDSGNASANTRRYGWTLPKAWVPAAT